MERVDQKIKAWLDGLVNRKRDQEKRFEAAIQESMPVLPYAAIGAYLPSPRTALKMPVLPTEKPVNNARDLIALPRVIEEPPAHVVAALNDLYPVSSVNSFFENDTQFSDQQRAQLQKPYGSVSQFRKPDKRDVKAEKASEKASKKRSSHSQSKKEVVMPNPRTENMRSIDPQQKQKPLTPRRVEEGAVRHFKITNQIVSKSINELVEGYFLE